MNLIYPILLLTSLSHISLSHGKRINKKKHKLITKTLENLENVTIFFDLNYEKVNLDSIFGLRVAEGMLHNLIREHKPNFKDDIKLLSEVRLLYSRIRNIGFKAYQEMETVNSQYFNTFYYLVKTPWYYKSKSRVIDYDVINTSPATLDEELTEEFSDSCVSKLISTKVNADNSTSSQCIVTNECWSVMTKQGTNGYYLTHQALYFILADLKGCSSSLEVRLSDSLENHFIYLGSNIYHQMKELYVNGLHSDEELDLYLEQSIICKWLGMDECFDKDTHEALLLWLHGDGCIKEKGYIEKNKKVISGNMRRLKEEKILSDGCLSHTTGLYVAYLSASVHWILTEYKEESLLRRKLGKFSLILCIVFVFIVLWTKFLSKLGRNCRKFTR